MTNHKKTIDNIKIELAELMKGDCYSLNNIGEITNLLLKAANTAEALLAENEALKARLE